MLPGAPALLGCIVAGGPAPLIAVALLARYGSGYAVAGYIFVSAIVSSDDDFEPRTDLNQPVGCLQVLTAN